MRVLDTAALLHWPVDAMSDGVCAHMQRQELEQLSEARLLLLEQASIQWHEPNSHLRQEARKMASESGDLVGLSDVDLDVLALAIHFDCPLVSDDYRLQNVMRTFGKQTVGVVHKKAQSTWQWHLRCTGCRATQPVPQDLDTRTKNIQLDCDICGSPLEVKRKK